MIYGAKMLKTSQFHFDPKSKILSAEASELPDFSFNGGRISVQSILTNKAISFKLSKTAYDNSHEDIQAWEFVPEETCNVKKLVIYND